MSGGAQKQNGSNTTSANPIAMAAFTDVMGGAKDIAARNQQWDPSMGVNVAGFNDMQNRAFQGINSQYGQYQSQFDQAMNLAGQAGQGVSGSDIQNFENPYTQDVINSTMANAQQQQGVGMANVVGNEIAQNAQGGDRAMLQKAMTSGQYAMANNQTIAGLQNQNYSQALAAAQAQKGQQLQASYGLANQANAAQQYNLTGLSAMMGAGNQQQGLAQSQLNANTQNAQSKDMWQMQLQSWLAGLTGSMGSLMGGTTDSSSKTSDKPGFANWFGMGAGLAGSLSDERTKENKKVIGETYDGQKIYSFNYKGSPATQLGLMAQEVEHHHPESVGETPEGLKTVRYDMATEDAARRGHFADGGRPRSLASGGNPFDVSNNPFGGVGGNPWGSLLQNAPQAHPNFAPAAQAPDGKALGQKQKEMQQQGKEGGKGIKEAWDKYQQSQGKAGNTSGTKNPWDTQTVPSDSPAATGNSGGSGGSGGSETLVTEPGVTVTDSSSGLGSGALTMGPGADATAATMGGGAAAPAAADAAGTAAGAGAGAAGAAEAAGAAGAGTAAAADAAAAGTAAAAGGAGEGSTAALAALALLLAKGGRADKKGSDAMHAHARRMLRLAGGGAADGAAEGDEPFDEPQKPMDTPDIREGMFRAPHEQRTHYDPYMGKFPKMEPTVPHEKAKMMTRAPEIPEPGESESRVIPEPGESESLVIPEYAPKIPEAVLSDRPITAPQAVEMAQARANHNITPHSAVTRGQLPEPGMSTEIPKFPAGVDVTDVGRKAVGKIVDPYAEALRDKLVGIGGQYAQAGKEAYGLIPSTGLRLPNRADVSELMQSIRGAPAALSDVAASRAQERDIANEVPSYNEGPLPPLPERNIVEKSKLDAERELAAEAGKEGPTPPLPERNLLEKSKLDAERELEDEKRAKLQRYADFAQNAVRLNGSESAAATPEQARVQAEQDRAVLKGALHRIFPSLLGEHPAEVAPGAKPLTPEMTGLGEAVPGVAPTLVKTTPPGVKGEEAYKATQASRIVEPGKAHEAEPYSAAVGAPKAGNHAEETPSRYEAGARTPMTKRLGFENDLGGVTRDTGGNPSMGNYGILATPGGGSSAEDFNNYVGKQLGFTVNPREDPWGYARQWQEIAKRDPQGLEAGQEKWHDHFIKGSVRAHMLNAGLPGGVADDQRVQDYFQDRYVQHGTGISKNPEGRNGANRIKRSWEKAEGDIPTFLKNMSAEDKAHVRHDFETYLSEHPSHQGGLEKRISNRLNGALGEKVQPGGASEQVTKQAEGQKEAADAAPKSAAELLPHEQKQVNFIQKILGGWNPLEGMTGPGADGKDSWNPLGLTSQQRQNLTMMGLSMMGGDPRGMRAFGAGAQGLQQAQQMQMNEQSMGVQRAKLALEAMNQPKFQPVHWNDIMDQQHAGSMDVHSGAITEAGQTAPVPSGSVAPGSVQATPGAAGAQPTGEPAVDQMFKQYPGMRDTTEGLLNGSINISQVPARQRGGYEEAAQAVARSRGEVWSPVINEQRNKFRAGFLGPESKTATQIESLNRASDHIKTLMDLSEQLGNHSTIGGKLAGAYHDTLSKDPVRDRFKFMSKALSSELARLESGGKGAQRTQEEWEALFNASDPKASRDGAVMQAFDLMKGNRRGLDMKWQTGMQGKIGANVPDYMAPEVRRNIADAERHYERATGKTPSGEKVASSAEPLRQPAVEHYEAVQSIAKAKQAGRTDLIPLIIDRAKQRGVQGLEVYQ